VEASEVDRAELVRLCAGEHADPHQVLGRHGDVVRARHPVALAMRLVRPDGAVPMRALGDGLFEGRLGAGTGASPERSPSPPAEDASPYLLEVDLPGGRTERFEDPYRFWPTLGEMDLYLFGEGRHHRLWEALGARVLHHQGVDGVAFSVWAPTARSVRVVGDWNGWDGRVHPMRSLGASGVWEIFVPGVLPGARYKFEILSADGALLVKADPMARDCEVPPATASIVAAPSAHRWGDEAWRAAREARGWPGREQMSIYEVHLGSWRRVPEEGHRSLTYRELARELPAYVKELGFTHVELMPPAAHPFEGSWGYQVTSYYAPSPRFGTPDDFRALVDAFHHEGIGVIVDWVPAHFPRDAWALARFDGSALYEHADPRQGAHPDWGTLVFNFGRHEVRNFLVANALYWLEEFHIDGLRVDAVASMLYLDYSRKEGEWIPNAYGGRENLEAMAFLRELNEVVGATFPGAITVAEESTAWPGVSRPTYLGGLGFSFKWNMGWMHDTLRYFSKDPIHRRFHQGDLTFGLLYAWSENFVLPLSHDEVVHGKGPLIEKMPGDRWQQRANLRALFAWMWAHPGKQLLFMGGEFGDDREWRHDESLDWHLLDSPGHAGIQRLVAELNRMQAACPALYEEDFRAEGFRWIDASDADANVASFLRLAVGETPEGPASEPAGPRRPAAGGRAPHRLVACIANFAPVVRAGYRVGLPRPGHWRELLNTDAVEYGGSGVGNAGVVVAEEHPAHGFPYSAALTLPPLGVLWLAPSGR